MKKKANPTDIPNSNKIFLGLELSKKQWGLCFSNGKQMRRRSILAGDTQALIREIALCKAKFKLEPDTPVFSCYEAGRDGFWLHRFLGQNQIHNLVFDSASIEVNPRSKQTKTDKTDAEKLVKLLMRMILWDEGKVCALVKVPSQKQEAEMRLARERQRLIKERTAHRLRIRSLLMLHGIDVKSMARLNVRALRDFQAKSLPEELIAELEREQERMKMAEEQIKEIEALQKETIKGQQTPSRIPSKVSQLMNLQGIGIQSAWILCYEFFWRDFKNRKEVGACAGLTGCPYDSGQSRREQGISKAGNKRVRTCCVEMAWSWMRFQPQSDLTKWFLERYYRNGTSRSRRVGIVALARKLLIALWKYLEHGQLPAGMLCMKAS